MGKTLPMWSQHAKPRVTQCRRTECRNKGGLKHSNNSRKIITKEEAQALAELRKDESRVILTANKGVALVVMDRTEYNNKAQDLIEEWGNLQRN